MPDPRKPDPRFPDRPTHPDFVRLSEAAQAHDALAEQLDVPPFEVAGVDEESFLYFVKNRLGISRQRGFEPRMWEQTLALYLDAFALGKAFAENRGPFTAYEAHVLIKACEAINDNPSEGRYRQDEIDTARGLIPRLRGIAGTSTEEDTNE